MDRENNEPYFNESSQKENMQDFTLGIDAKIHEYLVQKPLGWAQAVLSFKFTAMNRNSFSSTQTLGYQEIAIYRKDLPVLQD